MAVLAELTDVPSIGRIYRATRRVSIADAGADDRMRFDAIARFLGDVGNDDTDDAGLGALGLAWVVRRSGLEVRSFPKTRELLTMTTWCSGTGKRWAERRTRLTGDRGGHVEAVALWVHVDPSSGRPKPWPNEFGDAYLDAAQGREVSSRLALASAPPDDADLNEMSWSFRRTDVDLFGHINNAAYLAVLEEAFGGNPPPVPVRVDIEWHAPTHAGIALTVSELLEPDGMTMWIRDGQTTCAVIAGRPL